MIETMTNENPVAIVERTYLGVPEIPSSHYTFRQGLICKCWLLKCVQTFIPRLATMLYHLTKETAKVIKIISFPTER